MPPMQRQIQHVQSQGINESDATILGVAYKRLITYNSFSYKLKNADGHVRKENELPKVFRYSLRVLLLARVIYLRVEFSAGNICKLCAMCVCSTTVRLNSRSCHNLA